jgi:nitrate reductase gamma subunit
MLVTLTQEKQNQDLSYSQTYVKTSSFCRSEFGVNVTQTKVKVPTMHDESYYMAVMLRKKKIRILSFIFHYTIAFCIARHACTMVYMLAQQTVQSMRDTE